MRYFYAILFFCLSFYSIYGQKNSSFEGILTYQITNVTKIDSTKMQTVIFCKDSLIKVVNFNEQTGRQELLKHLIYNKSYILVDIENVKYAVRTKEHLQESDISYSFKRKCGRKKIGSLWSKKILVKYNENKLPLTCYFSKKINPKYANAMLEFPGLPTLFYTFGDRQIFRHTLIEYEKKELPLSIFGIPENYIILSWEEFVSKFSE